MELTAFRQTFTTIAKRATKPSIGLVIGGVYAKSSLRRFPVTPLACATLRPSPLAISRRLGYSKGCAARLTCLF